MNLNKALIKEYEGKSLGEILDAPPFAIEGVTPERAQALEEYLGIKTVADLAQWPGFLAAQAIYRVSGYEDATPTPSA